MRTLLCLGIVSLAAATLAHAAVIGKATVTAEQAPVMSGKQVIATAKKGDTFDVTELKGDWFGVAPSQGWIHKGNVRFEAAAAAGSAAGGAGSTEYLPLIAGAEYEYRGSFDGKTDTVTYRLMPLRVGQRPWFYFIDAKHAGENEAFVVGCFPWAGAMSKRADGIAGVAAPSVRSMGALRGVLDLTAEDLRDDRCESVLRLPLAKGGTTSGRTWGGRRFTATVEDFETVTVPAGVFQNCARILWSEQDPRSQPEECRFWLAPGVGMVRWVRATKREDVLLKYTLPGKPGEEPAKTGAAPAASAPAASGFVIKDIVPATGEAASGMVRSFCAVRVEPSERPPKADGYALILTINCAWSMEDAARKVTGECPFKIAETPRFSFGLNVTGPDNAIAIVNMVALGNAVGEQITATVGPDVAARGPVQVSAQIWAFSGGTWSPVSNVLTKSIQARL